MKVAYIAQRGQTGARHQAEVIDAEFDDVTLVFGNPLEIEESDVTKVMDRNGNTQPTAHESDAVAVVNGNGVVRPTESLVDAVAALDPDIVLGHIFNNELVATLSTISTFAPTVIRAGINPHEAMLSGSGNAQHLGLVLQTLQSFDHFIAPAEIVRRDLNCVGVEDDRIDTIPTALSMDQLEPPDPNTPSSIGCLAGRLSPLKNQHTLILALGGLRELDPTLRVNCYLPGSTDQSMLDALRSVAAVVGVGQQVEFQGYIDPEVAFFPKVGVHCLPSFSERMPQAVLEAARAGIPSIVGDGAWARTFESIPTVRSDDPLAWAETIQEYVTNDAKRMELAQTQQEEVFRRFDIEDVGDQYRDVFERVIDRTREFKVDPRVVA